MPITNKFSWTLEIRYSGVQPFYFSLPFTLMKLRPLSLAMAFAKSVLPQPGGPAKRIPGGWVKPSCSKCSGYLRENEAERVKTQTIKGGTPNIAYRIRAAFSSKLK